MGGSRWQCDGVGGRYWAREEGMGGGMAWVVQSFGVAAEALRVCDFPMTGVSPSPFLFPED
jgi:hypothetical protein